MIPLRIAAQAPDAVAPFVVRVGSDDPEASPSELTSASVASIGPSRFELVTPAGPLLITGIDHTECVGDVLLVFPQRGVAHRLIRAASSHNTFLVTEQCDQSCIMCSQPPKKHHLDLFRFFEVAALLAPQNMMIGVSGGEPTLHKSALLGLIERVLSMRYDLSFHVLTNGQHFDAKDRQRLLDPAFAKVVWGIPLYAADSAVHDAIVKKPGAFARLMDSFVVLAKCGAEIELRTVLLRQNADQLPTLASFISRHLPFVARWAIMQVENIGYARMAWREIFYDHSRTFEMVAAAVDVSRARGMDVRLYNFPLCTVPQAYRGFADCSISDWKRRYLATCEGCRERERCTGFFEWYPEGHGFMNIARQ